jgi:hypothetical protein
MWYQQFFRGTRLAMGRTKPPNGEGVAFKVSYGRVTPVFIENMVKLLTLITCSDVVDQQLWLSWIRRF